MINKQSILAWGEVQTDLCTDENGRVFGVENDLFNNHICFYIRYPDNSEEPIMTDDVYKAIDIFNGNCVNNTF